MADPEIRTARAVGQHGPEPNGAHADPELTRRVAALETEARVQRSEINRLRERFAELERLVMAGRK